MKPFGELLRGLDLLALRLELLEVRLLDCSRSLGKPGFEAADPSREFLVGLPECSFRLDAELPCEVRDREQQIAHFLLGPLSPFFPDGRSQLGELFVDLVYDVRRPIPVESNRRGSNTNLVSAEERRECPRDSSEQRPGLTGVFLLARLDLLPLLDDAARRFHARGVAEDVRMTTDQLVADRPQ